MRSILVTFLLFFISELAFSETLSQLPSTMAPGDPILEEQNGKLLFPIFDSNTGKYTFDVERGKQIVRIRNK